MGDGHFQTIIKIMTDKPFKQFNPCETKEPESHRFHRRVSIDMLILFLIFCCPLLAEAGPYALSAHGDSAFGVKRISLPLDYARGNCAHCHEQHACIDGIEPTPADGNPSSFLVFAGNPSAIPGNGPYLQSNDFCFYCHAGMGSLQSGAIINRDYAGTFAGYITGSPAGIFEAFNQISYHNLYDIRSYSRNRFSWFSERSNPCSACHEPHLVKQNRSDPDNPLLTAISRSTDHGNLWGDNDGERLDDYTSDYQAPYYHGSTTLYEPGGTSVDDGSLVPDYNTFCLDCHQNDIIRPSDHLTIRKVDWQTPGGDPSSTGDKHGRNVATSSINANLPYRSGNTYVLSCLDCHEPHGSPNVWLIRRHVNGQPLSAAIGDWNTDTASRYLCARCHQDDWETIHHNNSEAPYLRASPCARCHSEPPSSGGGPPAIPCGRCHFHGAFVNDCDNTLPVTRRTF
jgi:hypothetical protein